MSEEKAKVLEEALSNVSTGRRSFLKRLLIGSAIALPLMKSEALAQDNDNVPKKKKKKTPDNGVRQKGEVPASRV